MQNSITFWASLSVVFYFVTASRHCLTPWSTQTVEADSHDRSQGGLPQHTRVIGLLNDLFDEFTGVSLDPDFPPP